MKSSSNEKKRGYFCPFPAMALLGAVALRTNVTVRANAQPEIKEAAVQESPAASDLVRYAAKFVETGHYAEAEILLSHVIKANQNRSQAWHDLFDVQLKMAAGSLPRDSGTSARNLENAHRSSGFHRMALILKPRSEFPEDG